MFIYFLILIVAVFVAWIASRFAHSALFWLFFAVVFAIVTVPAVIRYGIGTDYLAIYTPAIAGIIESGEAANVEASFNYIVRFLSGFSEEPQVVFALFSIVTFFVAFLSFPRKSFHFAIAAYLMHYYAFTLSGIRQGVALSFLFWGIVCFLRRKYIWMAIAVGVAMCLHRSSAFLILSLVSSQWLSRKRNDGMIWSVLVGGVVLWAVDLSGLILPFVAKTPYAYYFERPELLGGAALSSGLGYFLPAAMFYCLFVILYLDNDYTKISRKMGLMCAFSVFVYAVAIHVELFRRFALVADTVLPFAVARLSRRMNSQASFLCLLFVFACLVAVFCKEIFCNANYGVVPYTTIFDEGVPLW